MSEVWRDEPEQAEGAIQVYEGRPHDFAEAGELSRFGRFAGWLFPQLNAKWDMAERLAEAKVRQEQETTPEPAEENRKATKGRERSLWKRFWGWLFPCLTSKWAMVDRLAEAKVRQEKATAVKIAAEAHKIAAEAAEIAARLDSQQQGSVKKVIDLVDDLGIDEETAQALKLAKMIEAAPAISAQIEKVDDIIERLRLVRGVTVGQIKGALPMPPDSGTGDTTSGEME